jgi:uncharacterized membrane protein YqjE
MKSVPEHPPRRDPFTLLLDMTRTRLDLAQLELEAHVLGSLGALVTGAVAVVLALIGFAFVGIVFIAIFWDTHRVAAAVGAALAYLLLAFAVAGYARARWQARPAPFAATLRELELDRDVVRELGRGAA